MSRLLRPTSFRENIIWEDESSTIVNMGRYLAQFSLSALLDMFASYRSFVCLSVCITTPNKLVNVTCEDRKCFQRKLLNRQWGIAFEILFKHSQTLVQLSRTRPIPSAAIMEVQSIKLSRWKFQKCFLSGVRSRWGVTWMKRCSRGTSFAESWRSSSLSWMGSTIGSQWWLIFA